MISLAVDAWTSPNHIAFLGVIAYQITKDWKYEEYTIGFEPLRGRHTGHKLALHVVDLLKFYGIEKRLFAITTDNAANNGTMRENVKKKLFHELKYVWNSVKGSIPCMAHIIQLVVKEIILELSIMPTNDKALDTFVEDDIEELMDPKDNTISIGDWTNIIKKVNICSNIFW
jgi:hypothetical protein